MGTTIIPPEVYHQWVRQGDIVSYDNHKYNKDGILLAIENVKRNKNLYVTEKAYDEHLRFFEAGLSLFINQ